MGFTVTTEQKLADLGGIALTGLYYTFRKRCKIQGTVSQHGDRSWIIEGQYGRYASLQAYKDGSTCISGEKTVRVSTDTLEVNVFGLLYGKLKEELALEEQHFKDVL